MKTLGKLKFVMLSALILLGTSSCLKQSDPEFGLGVSLAYILQNGYGENTSFQPAVYLQGNEPIKSANCKFEDKTYSFQTISSSNGYAMEINSLFSTPVDTVEKWTCTISATSANEDQATAEVRITFPDTEKPLSQFTLSEFKYTASDNKITAKWDKVDNATSYYLVSRAKSSSMWLAYGKLTTTGTDEVTGTISIDFVKGETFEIAIAAANRTFWLVSKSTSITGGTDTGF